MTWQKLVEVLPLIAREPLAILGYLALIAGWVLWLFRRIRSKDFLKALEFLPPEQRAEFCRRAGYSYDELARLTKRDQVRLITWRYLLVAYAMTLVGILLLAGLAAYYARLPENEINRRLGRIEEYLLKLARIDAVRQELQGKLDEEKRRNFELASGVAESAGRAAVISRIAPSPEIVELADKLRELVQEFKARSDTHRLSPVDDLRIRLAEATVANAERRYQDVRRLVREEDTVAVTAETEQAIAREIAVYVVLGDASYGLREWENAIATCQRILRRRPDHFSASLAIATCLHYLGRLHDAIERYNSLVNRLRVLVEQEGRAELANGLAECLNNRGNAYSALGKLPDAIRDLNEAVEIRTRLVEQKGGGELANDLASSLNNRGIAFGDLHKLQEAIRDLDKAVELRTRLVVQEGRGDLASDLAASLNNRGNSYRRLGRLREAIRDLDEAVQLLTRQVEQEGRSELASDLAASLTNRGNTYSDVGKLPEAIGDFDKAVEIRRRLVEQEGRGELASDLARSLNNRGTAFGELGKLPEAIRDFDKAVEILTRFFEQEGREERANELARSLNNRGHAFSELGKLPEAIRDFDKAVEIRRRLVEQKGRGELANDLAGSLHDRGTAYGKLGKLPESIGDFNEAVEILTHLVEQEGRGELASDLARSLKNRGAAFGELGKLTEAIRDFGKAVKLLTPLVDHEGPGELAGQLAQSLSMLAWVHATHSESAFRNGIIAVEYATRACQLTDWKSAACLDILAAAYAETGDFDTAVKWELKAIATAPEDERTELRVRLELYQAAKPYRQ